MERERFVLQSASSWAEAARLRGRVRGSSCQRRLTPAGWLLTSARLSPTPVETGRRRTAATRSQSRQSHGGTGRIHESDAPQCRADASSEPHPPARRSRIWRGGGRAALASWNTGLSRRQWPVTAPCCVRSTLHRLGPARVSTMGSAAQAPARQCPPCALPPCGI